MRYRDYADEGSSSYRGCRDGYGSASGPRDSRGCGPRDGRGNDGERNERCGGRGQATGPRDGSGYGPRDGRGYEGEGRCPHAER